MNSIQNIWQRILGNSAIKAVRDTLAQRPWIMGVIGLFALLLLTLGLMALNSSSIEAPGVQEPIDETPPVVIDSGFNLSQATQFNPTSTSATRQQADWATTQPENAALLGAITDMPTSIWLTKGTPDIRNFVDEIMDEAEALGQIPSFVIYNIPLRFCEAGGADNISDYKNWVSQIARGIDNRPAITIIEPDALPLIECLDETQQAIRIEAMTYAVQTFSEMDDQFVYIDAGHSDWVAVDIMQARLEQVGIEKAQGFSLNVSNFQYDADLRDYGDRLRAALGNEVTYVIDTSRNGIGPNGRDWCNPSQRALGRSPTFNTGHEGLDGYLWIKFPGESDGSCNGGPSEGAWWPEYALDLINNVPQ